MIYGKALTALRLVAASQEEDPTALSKALQQETGIAVQEAKSLGGRVLQIADEREEESRVQRELRKKMNEINEQNQKMMDGITATQGEISTGVANPLLSFNTQVEALEKNKKFVAKKAAMKNKFPGLTDGQIYMALAKESSFGQNVGEIGNWFQIKERIGGKVNEKTKGINFKKLNSSNDPVDHLDALDIYLSNWKYDGKSPLGLMLAAPGYAKQNNNKLVYSKDSPEAKKNPGWQAADGNVYVGSIKKFYQP